MEQKIIIYKKWFKILLVFSLFMPLITEIKYDSQNTSIIISEILEKPFINQVTLALPISKIILLLVIVLPFLVKNRTEKIVFSYYGVMLLICGIFQNIGITEYGKSFILGNFIAEFIVLIFVLYDLIKGKSKIKKQNFDKNKLWLIPFMLLSLLMPFDTNSNGIIIPSINNILINEAGVTYCMLTPIIIGILIMFNKDVYKPTLNIISFIGFIFGIMNMFTWFMMNIQNWWMGILHLPLLVISFYGWKISKVNKQ